MSNLIIGANGSMGKRYQAILKHLDEPAWCVDKDHDANTIFERAMKADRIIICTPTETHFSFLKKLLVLGKPILCEKPITKHLPELMEIFKLSKKHSTPFTMMLQYSELVNPSTSGASYYDYFRTGNDGLIWDCLQIIGLSKDDVDIKNESPVWMCRINGQSLKLSDMDHAYLNFVRKWIDGKINQDFEELFKMHEKTDRMENERNFRIN